MKILVVTEYMTPVGGAQTYLRALVPHLRVRCSELAIATNYACDEMRNGNFQTNRFRGIPFWRADDRKKSAYWQPDIVYYHGLKDAILEHWYVVNFRTVMYAHNFHGTCATGNKCHAKFGYRACGRKLSLNCLWLNYALGCGATNPMRLLGQYRNQRRRQRNLKWMRSIFVASNHVLEDYLREGIPREKTFLLPYFPTDVVPTPEPPQATTFRDRILMASRLTRIKGVGLLPKAVAIARQKLGRNLELLVAGTGPQASEFLDDCRDLGIDPKMLGWIERNERSIWMKTSDILAVPSLWPEPFGIVGIEAACLGLPAVAFPVGGIGDWLVSGESGELAVGEDRSPENFADAIVRALGDQGHWNKLRAGAWNVSKRFCIESHLLQLLDVFRRVTDSAPLNR